MKIDFLRKRLLFLTALINIVWSQIQYKDIILEGYDKTIPPNGLDLTVVDFDVDFRSVRSIIEEKMHLSLNIFEYQSWKDPRLAYADKNIP